MKTDHCKPFKPFHFQTTEDAGNETAQTHKHSNCSLARYCYVDYPQRDLNIANSLHAAFPHYHDSDRHRNGVDTLTGNGTHPTDISLNCQEFLLPYATNNNTTAFNATSTHSPAPPQPHHFLSPYRQASVVTSSSFDYTAAMNPFHSVLSSATSCMLEASTTSAGMMDFSNNSSALLGDYVSNLSPQYASHFRYPTQHQHHHPYASHHQSALGASSGFMSAAAAATAAAAAGTAQPHLQQLYNDFRMRNQFFPIIANNKFAGNRRTNACNQFQNGFGKRSDNEICKVCGANSSGFHFGVFTCEACKGFFRRYCRKQKHPDPCSRPCEINVNNRNNCPACRFAKCKSVGMAIENIRYGKPPKVDKPQKIKSFRHIPMSTNMTSMTWSRISQLPTENISTKESADKFLRSCSNILNIEYIANDSCAGFVQFLFTPESNEIVLRKQYRSAAQERHVNMDIETVPTMIMSSSNNGIYNSLNCHRSVTGIHHPARNCLFALLYYYQNTCLLAETRRIKPGRTNSLNSSSVHNCDSDTSDATGADIILELIENFVGREKLPKAIFLSEFLNLCSLYSQ